jgi:uncharacterized repeat protein (TIGR04138 family)
MATTDPDGLAQLRKQHAALRTACEKDSRYHFEACVFVCECVDYTCARLGGRRDIRGAELLDGMCDLALERFGYMAPTVLEHWGVRSTEDFGNIVFNLVETGLLGKSPQDSIDDFRNVFELREELERRYTIDPSHIEERPE